MKMVLLLAGLLGVINYGDVFAAGPVATNVTIVGT